MARKKADSAEIDKEVAGLATEDDPGVVDDAATEEIHSRAFTISSYGADYTVDMLVKRMTTKAFYVPDFQRAFVWNQRQSSRFIESLLMGLPVPGLFLFKEAESAKHLIIDGQQRLQTLQRFYDGLFHDRAFKLIDVADCWAGKTYRELEDDDRQRLDDSIIHTTIFKQDQPEGDKSSIYEVFERINTGGVKLSAQEIRSCVSHGKFIKLLRDLNANTAWRDVYGKESDRLKDQELILRFLALALNAANYKRPMRRFLDRFLDDHADLSDARAQEFRTLFSSTIEAARDAFGRKAFRPESQLNTAVFDSVMIGLWRLLSSGRRITPAAIKKAYDLLLQDEVFKAAYTKSTADEDQVATRLQRATDALSKA